MSSLPSRKLLSGLIGPTAIVSCAFVLYTPSIAGDAAAAENRQRGVRIFSVHDIDRDGRLSRWEHQRLRERLRSHHRRPRQTPQQALQSVPFERIDGDQDGYLSEEELLKSVRLGLKRHRHYRYQNGSRGTN